MNRIKAFVSGLFGKARAIWQDREKRRELITYLVFGVLTTAVNYLVYWLMTEITGMRKWPQGSGEYVSMGNISNFTAWVAAVLFAFVTNKKFVFRSGKRMREGALKELLLFFASRVASYLIFDLALYTLCLYIMPDLADKLLMNVLVVIFNYFMSKLVVFKNR